VTADEVQFLSSKNDTDGMSDEPVFDDLKSIDEDLPF
jgi:hypothetical protein